MSQIDGKVVFVTGACGTIGMELVEQLLINHSPAEVICVDINESELFFLEQRFAEFSNIRVLLADVRDKDKLLRVMRGAQIVFHTAAYKHVIMCERSPFEAVRTNIMGVQNIIEAAQVNEVEKVIFTSSDKAVNPTSVMGTSKLMGERLVTAANSNVRSPKPMFISTRFGNVLGSRGSVIPIFRKQIERGGPLTLTEDGMTRFIMSVSEAVRLVIDSASLACGGEVFITKMPVIRIKDLAEVMINDLAPMYGHAPEDIKIEVIGCKPGEKLYEELMSGEECRRSRELEDYFVVLPAFTTLYRTIEYEYDNTKAIGVDKPYHSANEACLSQDELRTFLRKHKLIEEERHLYSPEERYWPDDKEGG